MIKQSAGKYRNEQGVAIGYRRDDSREFFETRIRNRLHPFCEPSIPVAYYNTTVLDLWMYLTSVATMVLVHLCANILHCDPFFLLDMTDLLLTPHILAHSLKENPREGSIFEQINDENNIIQHDLFLSSSILRICRYPQAKHFASTNPNDRYPFFILHVFVVVSF